MRDYNRYPKFFLFVVFAVFQLILASFDGHIAVAQNATDLHAIARSSLATAATALQSQNERLGGIASAAESLTKGFGNHMSEALADGVIVELKLLKSLQQIHHLAVQDLVAEESFVDGNAAVSLADLKARTRETTDILQSLVNVVESVQRQRRLFAELLETEVNSLIQNSPGESNTYISVKQRLSPPALDRELLQLRLILAQLTTVLNVLGT